MTKHIPCELSVDTVTLNWYNAYNVAVEGWKYTPANDKKEMDVFTKFMQDGIVVRYYPCCSLLSVSFSASRVANGYNCYEYTNDQYDYVKDNVEKALTDAVSFSVPFESGIISRLDVYRPFVLPTVADCKAMIAWLQAQPVLGKYQKKAHSDNGERRWFKTGLTLNAYIKNEDPHLPLEIREQLPPTVRVEVQARTSMRRKLIGKQVRATILRYPALWVSYYNDALNKFRLAGSLYDEQELSIIFSKIMHIEHYNPRPSTIEKGWALLTGVASNRKKAVALLNKVYAYDICPFPMDNPAMLSYQTLVATPVTSVDQQRYWEETEEILERTIAVFKECLRRREETSVCKTNISHTPYAMRVCPVRVSMIDFIDTS